jgi:hypothetical protein
LRKPCGIPSNGSPCVAAFNMFAQRGGGASHPILRMAHLWRMQDGSAAAPACDA